jgi:hypothetical protein
MMLLSSPLASVRLCINDHDAKAAACLLRTAAASQERASEHSEESREQLHNADPSFPPLHPLNVLALYQHLSLILSLNITTIFRFGAFNWLDRLGFMPQTQYRVFMRGDGKTMVRFSVYRSDT